MGLFTRKEETAPPADVLPPPPSLLARIREFIAVTFEETQAECPRCGLARMGTPYGKACPRCDLRRDEDAFDRPKAIPEPAPAAALLPAPALAPAAPSPGPGPAPDPQEELWGPPPEWRAKAQPEPQE